jgi:hypothetical protein
MPAIHMRAPAAPNDTREEQLLDDAIDDSFPASDPVSHGQPGSSLNLHYAAEREARSRTGDRTNATAWLVLGGVVVLALMLAVRRRNARAALDERQP